MGEVDREVRRRMQTALRDRRGGLVPWDEWWQATRDDDEWWPTTRDDEARVPIRRGWDPLRMQLCIFG